MVSITRHSVPPTVFVAFKILGLRVYVLSIAVFFTVCVCKINLIQPPVSVGGRWGPSLVTPNHVGVF